MIRHLCVLTFVAQVVCACLLSSDGLAATLARQDGAQWRIENERIRVLVDPQAGTFSVHDKVCNYTWRQPGPDAAKNPGPVIVIRKARSAPRIDGKLDDWQLGAPIRITHKMLAHARKVDSDQDCSARVWLSWDEKCLYLAAKVADDALCFGKPGLVSWWEADAMEVWVAHKQVGLNLSTAGSRAPGTRSAAIGLSTGDRGYTVEVALPWGIFDRGVVGPGDRFPFAVGIDDADTPGGREGQIYFPSTWRHSTPGTFAQAGLADAQGNVPAPKPPPKQAKFRNVRTLSAPVGLQFDATPSMANTRQPLTVRMTVPDDGADLAIEIDAADRETKINSFVALAPLVLDTPEGVLVAGAHGRLRPLDTPNLRGQVGGSMDMPWVGIMDLETGHGYALIIETPDDCRVQMEKCPVASRTLRAPQVQWWPSHRTFRYPRRFLYSFLPKGGYVALAKRYRAYAKELGLLVTLAEKAKQNPNVKRLFGAPDLWGDASLRFAREAKALGVDKMIIHGHSGAKHMQAINDLGYLTSRYDNYCDLRPLEKGQEVTSNRGRIPEDVVLMANGKRKKAWLTFDKKTQYMKRCPARWVPAAKIVIPKELAKYPFLGRFIDVTTAEGLYECYDPAHPLTHTAKRECGVALESYVRSLGLVVGGEHGRWWGVPDMCYIEGMMSGGGYSWPAGHLKHPKTKEDTFESPWGGKYGNFARYEKVGIGHEHRVPLWELVFHDCIVTTWYWGDASDWLLDAAPEVTPKKDAFNVLCGTIPLMWASAQGAWRKDREAFLRTYRNTCKLHEQVAGEEMLTHEFVTPDRAVQRTVFSSGTECVVNFGAEPRQVTVKGESFLLPQNGFAVRGPKVKQSLVLVKGKPVTTIRTPGYWYSDAGGAGLTMRAVGEGSVSIVVEPSEKKVAVRPQAVASDWDAGATLVYLLDVQGARGRSMDCRAADGALEIGPFTERTRLEALCGTAARVPDIALDVRDLKLSSPSVAQGAELRLDATVRNLGLAAAKGSVTVFADQVDPTCQLASQKLTMGPKSSHIVDLDVPTGRLDGRRVLVVVAKLDGDAVDLCERNNSAEVVVVIKPNLSHWPQRVPVTVDVGPIDRVDEPVSLTIDFGPIMRKLGLKGALDAAALRVAECDAKGKVKGFVPAQFDPAPDFDATRNPKGEMCWLMPGRTPKGAQRQFAVLLRTGPAVLLPARGRMWRPEDATVDASGYVARFTHGVLTSLAPKVDGKAGPDFLRNIVVSSKATGFNEELDAKVERFETMHVGPVRCTVFVRKALKAGVVYEKTYTFYPKRFDVKIDLNKPAGGLYSRAHYRLPSTYVDDKGIRAEVDGRGPENSATYGKNKKPRWYALFGKEWAHSCIALSKFGSVAYWDGGVMGSIGFTSRQHKNLRMSYVVHPEQKDAAFAEADWQRLTNPVSVRLVE